jgi:hypothetical protein
LKTGAVRVAVPSNCAPSIQWLITGRSGIFLRFSSVEWEQLLR